MATVTQETVLWDQTLVLHVHAVFVFIHHCVITCLSFYQLVPFIDGKPDMINLMRLSTKKGVLKIIELSAFNYRDIGTILLNDTSGARVHAIREAALHDPVEAVYRIYGSWIREDVDHSWRKLAQCLKKCGLHVLASNIEKHFGLPTLPLSHEGTI